MMLYSLSALFEIFTLDPLLHLVACRLHTRHIQKAFESEGVDQFQVQYIKL